MRALVLSGGAVKGAYQIGVLRRWMGEQQIDYDIMCGVSVGALNVAGLSQVPYGHPKVAIDFMHRFWLERVNTAAIYQRWFPFGRLHALWTRSVYDSSPLQRLVRDNLDPCLTRDSGRKVAVGATCLDTGESFYARESDPNFIDWVLASSSYPIFLTPISINGRLWSDGGVQSMTPLSQAIRMGADEIDVIMCSNPWLQSQWSSVRKQAVPDQVIRTLDLMTDQIMRYDLQIVGLKNDEAPIDPRYHKVKVRLVQPHVELVTNSWNFDPADVRRMIDQGYQDAAGAVVYG